MHKPIWGALRGHLLLFCMCYIFNARRYALRSLSHRNSVRPSVCHRRVKPSNESGVVDFRFFRSLYLLSLDINRPVERGERGKVFPGHATFWGPRHRSKILKMVLQMASH